MDHTNFVVSCDWLKENLANEGIAITDCRFSLAEPDLGRQKYQTSHIPVSYYLDLNQDLSSAVKEHGGRPIFVLEFSSQLRCRHSLKYFHIF